MAFYHRLQLVQYRIHGRRLVDGNYLSVLLHHILLDVWVGAYPYLNVLDSQRLDQRAYPRAVAAGRRSEAEHLDATDLALIGDVGVGVPAHGAVALVEDDYPVV